MEGPSVTAGARHDGDWSFRCECWLALLVFVVGLSLTRPSTKTIRSFPRGSMRPSRRNWPSPWRHLRVRTQSSRRAFGLELTPFGAVSASSTIHVRPLGGSPPPSVALLVHQLREGLAPLGQRQVSALRR